MNSVLAGLAAAGGWAAATVGVSRLSQSIGTGADVSATLSLGFVATLTAAGFTGLPAHVDAVTALWLGCAGVTSMAGFVLASLAFRHGGLGLVVPVISTEGAIAALLAIAAGEHLRWVVAAALVAIAIGVLLATRVTGTAADAGSDSTRSILPSRLAGVAFFALPYTVMQSRRRGPRRRLRRRDLAWVVFAESADLIGLRLYTLGARHSIAVTAVVAAQASPLAVAFACVFLKERLSRIQTIGFAVITAGVIVVTLGQQ